MLKSHRDPALLWLIVFAYAVHIGEEWVMGFPQWVARIIDRPMPGTAFLVINALAWLTMAWAVASAIKDESRDWLGIGVATIVVINAGSHVLGVAVTGAYAPGVVTALLLYVPLGGLVLLRARSQADPAQLRRGLIGGFLVHAGVFLLAYATSRLS